MWLMHGNELDLFWLCTPAQFQQSIFFVVVTTVGNYLYRSSLFEEEHPRSDKKGIIELDEHGYISNLLFSAVF